MRRLLLLFAVIAALGTAALNAQPKVSSVVNGADYSTTVAPGSLTTIFGTGLAAAAGAPSALPFPSSFTNVSVSVNGRAAPIVYVNPTQINFQIPAATTPGTASVTVTNAGQTSAPITVPVAASAIGIFQYGSNHGIVQNQDYSLNSATAPAAAGSIVTVYLTGIGQTTPAVVDGNASPSSPLARPNGSGTALVGGLAANLLFLGLTPGNVGLAQANVQVPPLKSGDYPLTLSLNGGQSKSVIISVSGGSASGAGGTGTPSAAGPNCLSGRVDYTTYSRQNSVSGLTDDISIGGTKLCATCTVKPPLYAPLVTLLSEASELGLPVDVCYDSTFVVTLVRLKQP